MHFFDLFAGWLGAGEVVAAQASRRHGTNIEDQVQCTVRYGDDVHVNFYHGFQQTGRMDRQELRLVFERGDLLLHGWVPTYARVHAIADESDTRRCASCFPVRGSMCSCAYGPKDRHCVGHGREYDVYQQFELHWGEGRQKSRVYCELLRSFMADQIAWIRDRDSRAQNHRAERARLGRDAPVRRIGWRTAIDVAETHSRFVSQTCTRIDDDGMTMIKRLATHLLLRPEDVPPSHPDWEVIGVFNPGVARHGDDTVILARVAERPREQRAGWTAHPRWSADKGYVVDWVRERTFASAKTRGSRAILHTGLVRLTFISHLRVVRQPRRANDRRSRRADVSSGKRNGRVWPGRPADHADRWPVLHHVRGRFASRPGNRAGFDDRFQNDRSAWDNLLSGEQRRRVAARNESTASTLPCTARWATCRFAGRKCGSRARPTSCIGESTVSVWRRR